MASAAVDDPGADGPLGVTIKRMLTVFGYDDAPHGPRRDRRPTM
jgi:hypothetical protein